MTAAAKPALPVPMEMLSHAVEEAARLLEADGAMVYLIDDGMMRFAVDAGIPLAVFPGGTFNHFANDIGCETAAKTVDTIKRGSVASRARSSRF